MAVEDEAVAGGWGCLCRGGCFRTVESGQWVPGLLALGSFLAFWHHS